ncbi:bestrophin family ion channel [Microcoleus sp. S13_C5]|uniref:bestrophin family ion channel n=1 Tax=Microcoleus sp. S13_C5 TaxID=3055411 RepID=UPI002FD689F3
MSVDQPSWFKIALQVRGSVIPSILPRVLLCGGFGLFISFLYFLNLPVSLPILSSIVPSIVLGLLLVFRTNTAYERFWEGRRFWGTLNNNIRNLARQIWVAIEEKDPQDIIEKKSALRLLVALAVAMKLHLRKESVNPELEPLMSPAQYQKLKSMNNPPLEIAFWIEDYMHQQYERNCLDVYQLTGMNELLNSMIDVLGGCERILKTPIPLAYAIHLKQLLLLYSLALPFQMVKDLGWGTGPVVALISFTLFGIEEIGIEIENPFGHDANDLPLDNICAAMQRNMDDLISLSPSVHERVKDK